MAKYINIEKFENTSPYCPNCGNNCERECEFFRSIFAENIVEDVVPVVHANWVGIDDDPMGFRCSECGEMYWGLRRNFCPNCGAKMDSEPIYSYEEKIELYKQMEVLEILCGDDYWERLEKWDE